MVMKLSKLLSLMGVTVLLSTVSVNPSSSQSLKDKVNQQQSEKQKREKNCQTIEENTQYEKEWSKSRSSDPSPSVTRYYVDSSKNVHSVSLSHEWSTHHPNVPKLPNDPGRTIRFRTGCKPFIGKIGEQKVNVTECNFRTNGLGQTYSLSYKDIREWSVEGDELKEYHQTITTENCHTNNPTTREGGVSITSFKKYR